MSNPKICWILEVIVLIILGSFVFVVIYAQANYEDVLGKDGNVIAQFLLFIISAYIGWRIDSIRSRKDNFETLRKYGLLAVRRTEDTLLANDRLIKELKNTGLCVSFSVKLITDPLKILNKILS